MLYQAIRPQTLDEFKGSPATVASLKKAIKAKEHAHVYLLQGPSGCGKTTLARIVAKAFGAIDHNIIEKNAASERGIDMARELEKYSKLSPLGGGNRAIILDEAARLTKDAQSALLKVLEDVPKYQYYFLCTTDPGKLLNTIRTRCDKQSVSPLSDKDMEDMLLDSAERAKIDEPHGDVLDAIIENASGCPREALVMLEKQDGLKKSEALDAVESHLTRSKAMIDLCRVLLKGQWGPTLATYKKLESPDPEEVRRSLLGYLKSCLLKSKGKEAGRFIDMMEELCEPTYDSGEAKLLVMMYRAITV